MGWLEVKSTGLDENGNWDNRFGSLRWGEDFDKLKGITTNAWNLHHIRAWVWLYQFENYREQVDGFFGTSTEWSIPRRPLEYSSVFGPIHAGNINLPRVLSEIASASGDSLMSVRPRVRAHDQNRVFSALILAAMVTRS
jgi:hypothetical protein